LSNNEKIELDNYFSDVVAKDPTTIENPSPLELLIPVGIGELRGIEYIGNSLIALISNASSVEVVLQILQVANSYYNFAFVFAARTGKQRSQESILQRISLKSLYLEAFFNEIKSYLANSDEQRKDHLKKKYEVLEKANGFLVSQFLPNIDVKVLSISERQFIFIQSTIQALEALSDWPIIYRNYIADHTHHNWINGVFEASLHKHYNSSFEKTMLQTISVAFRDYFEWLNKSDGLPIVMTRVTAASLASLYQHRLQNVREAKYFYQEASYLCDHEINQYFDDGNRKAVLSVLNDQSFYLLRPIHKTGFIGSISS
jgi:hypothetical protein